MFRKNSQPKFDCCEKIGKHKDLSLIGNQIILDVHIENGFILKVDNYYVSLSNDNTQFTLKIPITEKNDEISLKVFGFFKHIKVYIPLKYKRIYMNNPILPQAKRVTKAKVKQRKFEIDLNTRINSPQMQVSSSIKNPKIIKEAQNSLPTVRLQKVTEPFFNYEIEKLKLKLNQEL